MSSDSESPLPSKCPVDHSSRLAWNTVAQSSKTNSSEQTSPTSLPTTRQVSSIPRSTVENWVYPSEAQFFAAMARKQHDPQVPDMKVIVPIHNSVNERTWQEVKSWENGRGGEKCGGVRLVSFKGRPGDRTPKAWIKILLGYTAPFDRHDWIVERCGKQVRYVIDFYAGRPDPSSPHLPSFHIDVRPALDNWDAVRTRVKRFWSIWASNVLGKKGS